MSWYNDVNGLEQKAIDKLKTALEGKYTVNRLKGNIELINDVIALTINNAEIQWLIDYIKDLKKAIELERKHTKEVFEEVCEREVRVSNLEERERKLKEFETKLMSCKTDEAKDRMRLAEYFVDNTEVDTKYDNTAFIKALGNILCYGTIEEDE